MSDYFPSRHYQNLLNEFHWNLVEGRRLIIHMRRSNRARRAQELAELMQGAELDATGRNRRKMPSPLLPIQINMEHREAIMNEIKAMNYNFSWSPNKIVRDVSCEADSKYNPLWSPDVLLYVEREMDRPQIPNEYRREVGTQTMWPLTDGDNNESRQPEDIEISPQQDDNNHSQSAAETQTHNDQPESSNAQPRVRRHVPIYNCLKKPSWAQHHDYWSRLDVFRESSDQPSQAHDIYLEQMSQLNQPYTFSRGYCHNFPLMTFRPLSSPGGFQAINSYIPPDNFPIFPPPHAEYRPHPTCFYDPSSRRPLAYAIPGRPLIMAQNDSNPLLPPRPKPVNNQIPARNNTNRRNSRPAMQPQSSTNEGAQSSKNILPKRCEKKRDA